MTRQAGPIRSVCIAIICALVYGLTMAYGLDKWPSGTWDVFVLFRAMCTASFATWVSVGLYLAIEKVNAAIRRVPKERAQADA